MVLCSSFEGFLWERFEKKNVKILCILSQWNMSHYFILSLCVESHGCFTAITMITTSHCVRWMRRVCLRMACIPQVFVQRKCEKCDTFLLPFYVFRQKNGFLSIITVLLTSFPFGGYFLVKDFAFFFSNMIIAYLRWSPKKEMLGNFHKSTITIIANENETKWFILEIKKLSGNTNHRTTPLSAGFLQSLISSCCIIIATRFNLFFRHLFKYVITIKL